MADKHQLEVIERFPEGDAQQSPILFIHGAWHGAWCWDKFFLPYFARQGFHVKALSLRGHGNSSGKERLRTSRIADYVKDVSDVVNTFGTPPVLVGHSMGGLVVQKYLESDSIPQIPKAVLLASVPPHGVWKTTLSILTKHPLVFLKVNLTLSLFPIVSTIERSKEMFFSKDMPVEQLETHFSKLQDESYLGFLDMLAFSLPKPHKITTPILVLGAEQDTVFSVGDIHSTAQAYQTQAKMFDNMAHDMMLEKDWQEVADYIIENI